MLYIHSCRGTQNQSTSGPWAVFWQRCSPTGHISYLLQRWKFYCFAGRGHIKKIIHILKSSHFCHIFHKPIREIKCKIVLLFFVSTTDICAGSYCCDLKTFKKCFVFCFLFYSSGDVSLLFF
jgi:hypothetical protein